MTLLELVVALVVTGLVISFGYAAFATVIDRREHANLAAHETARAAGLRRTLLQWMDGSVQQVATGGDTDPNAMNQLRFMTRTKTPMRSPVTGVRLFVNDGSDGFPPGLVAILRPDVGEDSLRVMLDPTARSMSIQYQVVTGGVRQWRTPETLVASESPLLTRLQVVSNAPDVAAAYALPIDAPTSLAR
jgi:type II secretory pathway pseudopilin PulG